MQSWERLSNRIITLITLIILFSFPFLPLFSPSRDITNLDKSILSFHRELDYRFSDIRWKLEDVVNERHKWQVDNLNHALDRVSYLERKVKSLEKKLEILEEDLEIIRRKASNIEQPLSYTDASNR